MSQHDRPVERDDSSADGSSGVESGPGRGASRTWVHGLWPLALSVVVLGLLQPHLVLTDTTPALGDFVGHVFPFGELAARVSRGQGIMGWSNGWFGGFPIFYFYFPLPGVMVAALAPVAGLNVAMKVVGILGLVGLPFAAAFLARALGLGGLSAGIAGAAGGSLALMTSYDLFGGNALSTLNGEFAYSLGFCFSLLYLGCALRADRDGGRWWLGASLCLAATATSHLIPTLAALVGTAPLLIRGRRRRTLLSTWALGFSVSAFWTVPFLAYRSEMATLPWSFGRSLAEVFPGELLWLVAPAAMGGFIAVRRSWTVGPLAAVMMLGLAAYVAPEGPFMRARLLPYWYLGVHLLAGMGLAAAGSWWVRRRGPLPLAAAVTALGCFALQNVLRDPAPIVRWAVQNHAGMEARHAWPDYRALLDRLAELPPGQVHWEDTDEISRFGSPYAMTAIPHWRPEHPVVGGLWVESSGVTPFYLRFRGETASRVHTRTYLDLPEVRTDLSRGRERMGVLGARYLLAFTEGVVEAARAEPGFEAVGAGESWTLFDAGEVALVDTAQAAEPVSAAEFPTRALNWWENGAEGAWPVEADRVAWERALAARPGTPPGSVEASPPTGAAVFDSASTGAPPGPPRVVEIVAAEDERLVFRTSAPGRAHLVRVPYFPNWRVTGAHGPYRAGPSLMMVVPTTDEVRLNFRPGLPERLGAAASLFGLLFAAALWLRATPGRRGAAVRT